jgi:hypothetical protein
VRAFIITTKGHDMDSTRPKLFVSTVGALVLAMTTVLPVSAMETLDAALMRLTQPLAEEETWNLGGTTSDSGTSVLKMSYYGTDFLWVEILDNGIKIYPTARGLMALFQTDDCVHYFMLGGGRITFIRHIDGHIQKWEPK